MFGAYTLDLRSGELRKFGTRVKMGEQTFQILRILLETQGELVTREELRGKLWADDTFVDFDHGLNSAVQRLRDCLSDAADKPRWIETVPRRGYRFIGQVEWSDNGTPTSEISVEPDIKDQRKPPEVATSSALDKEIYKEPPVKRGATRRRALLWVATLGVVVAALLTVKLIRDRRDTKRNVVISSLAVLPLENLSGDPAQEYFADGMTDEVITMLAKNLHLRVISRTSVMQYKKVHRPLPEIARELGVDGILEGSVGRAGNRVHMTAQLIYAPTDTHIWAESFDRDLSDVGALQNELAETIAKQVGITMAGAVGREQHINPEAHDAYLMGRYYWFAEDHEKSREYFQKAIALQPDYAAAWSGVSDSYCASAVVKKFPPEAVMSQAEAAAKKALELDDLSAEAHLSMAAIELFYRWNWAEAERESARAVELNPNFAEGHHLRAYTLRPLNRLDEALQEEKKAMELDPMSRSWALVVALWRLRQFDAVLNQARILSQAQPNNAFLHYILSEAYLLKGMEKESEQESERYLEMVGEKDQLAEQVQIYRRGGLRAVLEWNVEVLKQRAAKQYVSPTDFVDAYSQLGRKEETIHYLEESYRERSPHLAFMQSEPTLDFLHSDTRYRALVNKMGLPPAY